MFLIPIQPDLGRVLGALTPGSVHKNVWKDYKAVSAIAQTDVFANIRPDQYHAMRQDGAGKVWIWAGARRDVKHVS